MLEEGDEVGRAMVGEGQPQEEIVRDDKPTP